MAPRLAGNSLTIIGSFFVYEYVLRFVALCTSMTDARTGDVAFRPMYSEIVIFCCSLHVFVYKPNRSVARKGTICIILPMHV